MLQPAQLLIRTSMQERTFIFKQLKQLLQVKTLPLSACTNVESAVL